MKAIKTYISVYPLWYRLIVFIAVPVSVILYAVVTVIAAGSADGFDAGFNISLSAMLLIYAELFGEWFTLGEICVRKGAFGDVAQTLCETVCGGRYTQKGSGISADIYYAAACGAGDKPGYGKHF